MKYLILIILMISFFTNVNAQKRMNREPIKIIEKSAKFKNAKGWLFDQSTGKWISNKNVIYENTCSEYVRSHQKQNFNWLQTLKIDCHSKTYYVILFECLSGEYKYPEIYEDWEIETQMRFFILEPEDYKQLKSYIKNKINRNILLTFKYEGFISDKYSVLGGKHSYTEENLFAKISNRILTQTPAYHSMVLNIQNIEGKEIIRFLLPEDKHVNLDNKIMSSYFETPYDNFVKLLIE